MTLNGFDRYRKFFEQKPEKTIHWTDDQSNAEGWLVLNSLTGGAAGGGTRMRIGAKEDEAVFLAKTMEIKFGVCGPEIGGAKSVINFDPSSDKKHEVLERWFRHIGNELHTCYGTGGDLNVNEDEVCEITHRTIDLGHPQEGVVRGHYHRDGEGCRRIVRQLKDGVELPTTVAGQVLPLAEMLTGYGVAQSVLSYFEHRGEPIEGKRILVEGFGDVGGAAAYYLHEAGAKVVGAICLLKSRDFRWWVDPEGLDVLDLLARRENERTVLPAGGEEGKDSSAFWQTQADVFIPAASSHTIDRTRLDQLEKAGVRVISCGANTPFADLHPGDYDVQKIADERFAIIADFIANCGAARLFRYLMQDGAAIDQESMMADVRETIRDAVHKLLDGHPKETGLLERAFTMYVPG